MSLKKICQCLISLSLYGVSLAQAAPLSDWVGSKVSALSANFDRYDVDLRTGKMQGPFKGCVQMRRPGSLTLDMQGQHVTITNDYLQVTPCAGCKPVFAAAAKDVVGKFFLQLIADGSNADNLFNAKSTVASGDGVIGISYSLAPMGLGQGEFTLWSRKDRPAVVELNFTPGVKTVLQLYDLQRTVSGLSENSK